MKIAKTREDGSKQINGYTMLLSAGDTRSWAHKPGAVWPCSTLADKRVWVAVDNNGLYDIAVGGSAELVDIDNNELSACIADHLPPDCRHLWPTWESQKEG